MNEINVYSRGLVYMSACAPDEMNAEEIARQANAVNPSGVTPWTVADEDFRTGQSNPTPCNDTSGRRHWLLSC